MTSAPTLVRWLAELDRSDAPQVGDKHAALGEMAAALGEQGVRVPAGFATTAAAYERFVAANGIDDAMETQLAALAAGTRPIHRVGKAIRRLFLQGEFPPEVAATILDAYHELGQRFDTEEADVAIRASAMGTDLPEASFAGQQETFLNVRGDADVLDACRACYASSFTDRAISYRIAHGIDHLRMALSVGVMKMVRSDLAGAGVMFSIDPETGFEDAVVINAAWGLGETVVRGSVNPDEYMVFKPLLENPELRPIIEARVGEKQQQLIYAEGGTSTTALKDTSQVERRARVLDDDEVLQLARWAVAVERHFGCPMHLEWAKDGESGEVYFVAARPETVQSQRSTDTLSSYALEMRGEVLVSGQAIGEAITHGQVQVIESVNDIDRFIDGRILVTGMTDPDWMPILQRAAGVITDHGGRTCHAAVISRELGIPTIVGSNDATRVLRDGQEVTLSCAEGDHGFVYAGSLPFRATTTKIADVPRTRTQVMLIIASPTAALRWWRLPCHGIGLARMEFMISDLIQVHPMALLHFDDLRDEEAKRRIADLTHGYDDKPEFFVDRLARGIGKMAASQYPQPVIVRTSDFKTNEYAALIGGREFEPHEENPMLGFRGASRYDAEGYRAAFALECRAIRRVREELGFANVVVMIPFCRTVDEADRVLALMAEEGLERGKNGLEVQVMAEVPSNVLLVDRFAERFDGFSIGSNDLTQLILGIDRDSARLADMFDERDEAVKRAVRLLIQGAHAAGRSVGICGQAPSDYPEFAEFLVAEGIDAIALNPDSILGVLPKIAAAEAAAKAASEPASG
jgi:pyruvate,water dikinase